VTDTKIVGDASIRSVAQERRWLSAILSHEKTDRMNEVVRIAGIDTSAFEQNPVMLADHKSDQVVGRWSRLWTQAVDGADALLGEAEGLAPGISPVADRVWAEIRAGVRRGISVGFQPTELGPPFLPDQRGDTIERCVLLEVSSVAIPACPTCLVMPMTKCACDLPDTLLLDLDEPSANEAADYVSLDLPPAQPEYQLWEVRAALRETLPPMVKRAVEEQVEMLTGYLGD
jgi:Caudovirus prohead serine protease